MKSIFRFAIFGAALLSLIYSCNKYRAPHSRDAIEDRRTARESRYNLMGFPGDDSVITAGMPAADDTVREESDYLAFPDNRDTTAGPRELFSVQLYATKSSAEADSFRMEVQSLFDQTVVIDYKAPYYKVRVGEISTLEEGEALLDVVRGLGFPKAWLVRIRL